ncbi:hypothetical protein ACIRRA_13470 [Nocardia sp. NPDC101769]|uniref:hypothetical protein n=1 Tax=Nocardia sp. NPDC101769 TaxID=3364333 RepID=UPI00382211FE
MSIHLRGDRVAAWSGFVFGSVLSVAANWLHTWLPADHMPHGWRPDIAAQIGSAVWPVALLISVEVLSRVRWQPGFWWQLARYGGAGTVALGSAIISYGHVHDVLDRWGYGSLGAGVGPLVLDGLMVVSGFALLAMTEPAESATTATESAPGIPDDGAEPPADSAPTPTSEAATAPKTGGRPMDDRRSGRRERQLRRDPAVVARVLALAAEQVPATVIATTIGGSARTVGRILAEHQQSTVESASSAGSAESASETAPIAVGSNNFRLIAGGSDNGENKERTDHE